MGNGLTISQMMGGSANKGTGPVPTQTFYASNIAGTTVPKVGAVQGAAGSNSGSAVGSGISPTMVAVIVIAIIGGGYLLHHLTFEEGVKVG